MLSNKELIKNYNDKIEQASTNIEILNNRKTDTKDFVKVTSVLSGVLIPSASAIAYSLCDIEPNKLALYVLGATFGCGSAIFLGKKYFESENKEMDIKISDNLREIDRLSNEIALLENQGDNEIASTLIENRARIIKRTL